MLVLLSFGVLICTSLQTFVAIASVPKPSIGQRGLCWAQPRRVYTCVFSSFIVNRFLIAIILLVFTYVRHFAAE